MEPLLPHGQWAASENSVAHGQGILEAPAKPCWVWLGECSLSSGYGPSLEGRSIPSLGQGQRACRTTSSSASQQKLAEESRTSGSG